MTQIFRMPTTRCPVCNKVLDTASSIDGDNVPPQEGDYSYCWGCFEMLRFNADLTVRKMTDEEIAEMPEEQYEEMMREVTKAIMFKNRKKD